MDTNSGATPQDFRMVCIRLGLEAELIGFVMTRKAPKCFKIIASEFGIAHKRGDKASKIAAYLKFCEMTGQQPKDRYKPAQIEVIPAQEVAE